jgi:double-strand break repair protein MRE11
MTILYPIDSVPNERQVDMVLLAGDLFHENKPSRKSMYQVMRSLRMNCLGEKPCELEMLSDPSEVLNGAHVNYEDPDINVAIPVFSIHGNHDDPTGDGHYCSLDLLQVSGLINYIGRIPETDKLEIKPVLLQKGQTKLALYGMSNVRDERLFRTFRDGHVKFFQPGVQQKDWFNLMAVHQNHHAYSETGYLPENFLPEFLDLVIWGHEHECLIEPRLNPEMQFHVMQPGSSVATSLVPGEAVSKHVAILSVTGKEFKTEKIRLKSVRPFVTKDLVLADEARFRKLSKVKDNRIAVTHELVKVIDEMIEQAVKEWEEIQDPDDRPDETPLPLIRLRVEYTPPEGGKFDPENPQRFSNRFMGKVANVNDVVQFHRKKTVVSKSREVDSSNDHQLISLGRDRIEKTMPEDDVLASLEMNNVKVDRLVQEFLTAQSLKILPKAPFGDAVHQFVDKDDKHAMESFVDESLALQVKEMLALDEEPDEGDLEPVMEVLRQKQEEQFAAGVRRRPKRQGKLKPRPSGWDSDLQGDWEDAPGAYEESEEESEGVPASRRGRAAAAGSDDDASVISAVPAGKKGSAKKVPAKKAPAKPRAPTKAPARGRKKAAKPSEDEDEDVVMIDDEPPLAKAQPRRAATKGRQTQLNFSQPTRTQTALEPSDDEISDDDAFEPVVPHSRTLASASRKR